MGTLRWIETKRLSSFSIANFVGTSVGISMGYFAKDKMSHVYDHDIARVGAI